MNAELEKWLDEHEYQPDHFLGTVVRLKDLRALFDGKVLVPEACMNSRLWTKEMHDAWHTNIPDVQAAFAAVLAASQEQGK